MGLSEIFSAGKIPTSDPNEVDTKYSPKLSELRNGGTIIVKEEEAGHLKAIVLKKKNIKNLDAKSSRGYQSESGKLEGNDP